jgi:hypothetical protein
MRNLREILEGIENALLTQKEVLTLQEFCRYSGLSQSAAHKLTSERKIRHSKPNGKKIFITKSDADSYLQNHVIDTRSTIEVEAQRFVFQQKERGITKW